MYLRTLELHGFKSFADRTTVDFDPGITAIVGPNGCGKSNIVDAVRWAIGEQRPTVLRSEKMQNVIFNGTANRKPLGMAEVKITIENNRNVLPTEYSEVTIGRRLFQDGTSKYLMNDTTCRLKDITDLFMDTGMGADAYSVIELKMIDEIVSGSTADRRRMFEEAAGITRYKMRRRQALRKLDNTQDDLERIRDLTDEISTQVKRLKKQAKKAKQHRELSEELHTLELRLAQIEYDNLQDKRTQVLAEQEAAQMRADTLDQKHDDAEDRYEALRETLDQQETERANRREALQEHRAAISEMEAEQRLHRERLKTARDDRKEAQANQERDAERLDELTERAKALAEQLEAARPAQKQAESALKEAARKRKAAEQKAEGQREELNTLRSTLSTLEKEQTARRRTLDRHTNRLEMVEEARARAEDQKERFTKNAEAAAEQTQEARQAMEQAESELATAEDELASAKREHIEQREALDAVEEAYREAQRRRDAAEAEVELLQSLVSSYDEFSDAVQHLAEHGPFDPLTTVADVLSCADEWRIALDGALGDWAACVIVPTAADAQAAIQTLQADEAGQATFIVLDALPDPSEPATAPADTTLLRNYVRVTDDRYAPLADLLLRHCFVADSIEAASSAIDIAPSQAQIFTPTGTWIDTQGRRRGGSRQEHASPVASRVGRREQLDEAKATLADAQAACQRLREEHAAVETAFEQAETDLNDARAAVNRTERAFDRAEARYEQATYEQQSAIERRDEHAESVAEHTDEIEALKSKIETVRDAVEEAESKLATLRAQRDTLQEAVSDAETDERTAVDAHSTAKVEAVEARNRVKSLKREQDQTREQRESITERQAEREERISRLADTIDDALDAQHDLDEKIEAARNERSAYQEAVDEADEALQATKQNVSEVERTLRTLRQEREQAIAKENKAAVRRAEIDTRIEELESAIEEDFERDLDDDPVHIPDDFDVDDARKEVRSLRGKRNRIGDVNPLAVEEYAEEKERLDFLLEQQEDLAEAEATLLETIEEINTAASKRFEQTFEAIRTNFQELFAELFGDSAEADLALEDADDLLDAPIEIHARPPGKRPQTLEQLSSGEKALTSIALLFAIYLVKPSPFCILDEVDAPLDDTNVERFMDVIRRFASDTQFILVTHNQRTMALADRMYGVTMEENGVSKLVGVEFDEAVALTE